MQGTVASGQYLTWEGGPTATVWDANWNRVADLPVAAEGFIAPNGEFDCRIDTESGGAAPWLELQFMTRDDPIVVHDAQL